MLQYLILNNHLQSAKTFHHQSNLTWKQLLISSFTKGNRQSFFSIFQLLGKEEKLEFYLKVYFLIYSIHPHLNQNNKNSAIPEKQVTSFREFLDTKGADLAKTTEFLEFYALPFIKKPLEHATFKTLFTKTWISNLKEKLLAYIQIEQEQMKQATKALFSTNVSKQYQSQQKVQPTIIQRNLQSPSFGQAQAQSQKLAYEQNFRILQKTNKDLFDELQQIKFRYQALEQNHQAMIQGFNEYMMDSQNKWFESYKELVKTAKGLLGVVGQQIGDNPKLQRKYLQAKKKIDKYDRFVARKLQDLLSVSQDISVFDKPSVNEISQYTMKSGYTSKSWVTQMDKNISNNHNNITSYVQIDEYIPTNFYKLNNDFMKMHQEDQELILQGFCWRLIKAKSPQVRRMYCLGIIVGNFVGLGKVDQKSKTGELQLCTKFMTNTRLSFKVLQLLNYIKVDYYSRQYLFIEHNITSSLMQTMAEALQQGDVDTFTVALDLISTISVYKDYRRPILEAELPIFLLNVLESYPKLFQSQELMELIMMTLMNFSSCDQGLKMFQQYDNIFSLLSVVFQQESHDIMMLVNGFYYTLLASRHLYDIALESNMVQFVKYLLSNDSFKQHQRQLKFIEERLTKYCGGEGNNRKLDDSKDDGLYLVDGEEEGQQIQVAEEDIENLQEYIRGHQLLSSKYSMREKQADEQEKQIKKIDSQFAYKIAKAQQISQKKKLSSDTTKTVQPQQNAHNQIKNIPQQNRLKKPNNQMKSQEIQVSMISLNANQVQQSSIKQEIFNSPTPKIDSTLGLEKIPGNSKEAQFMGLLSKEKNPTFAKNKTEPNEGFNSPSIPMAQNHNLPNFGSISPQQELDPAQKSRRKQILKQLNEEIQSKKKLKVQRQAEKQKFKSSENPDKFVEQNGNFSKKKEPLDHEPNFNNEKRSNAHMRKVQEKQKLPKEKVEERKAFESRPKINRTPPKEENE